MLVIFAVGEMGDEDWFEGTPRDAEKLRVALTDSVKLAFVGLLEGISVWPRILLLDTIVRTYGGASLGRQISFTSGRVSKIVLSRSLMVALLKDICASLSSTPFGLAESESAAKLVTVAEPAMAVVSMTPLDEAVAEVTALCICSDLSNASAIASSGTGSASTIASASPPSVSESSSQLEFFISLLNSSIMVVPCTLSRLTGQ